MNADKTKALKEGDKGVAFLLCGKGQVIPARWLHLLKRPKAKPTDEEDTKIVDPIATRSTRIPKNLRTKKASKEAPG